MPKRARGLVGLTLVVVGVLVLGANTRFGTHVIISLTTSHGIHETDLIGALLVFVGTALVWFRS
jgi:hypothetical protein